MSRKYKNIAAGLAIIASFSAGLAAFSDHILGFVRNSNEISDIFFKKNKYIPFVIKSNVPDFAIIGTVTGEALVYGPFLKINLDTIVLRGNQPEYIESIRVGAAYYTDEDGVWGVHSWGEYKPINADLDETESITIDSHSTVIPIDQIGDVKKYWLVLEIRIKDEEYGHATTYSHSNKGIFEGI